MTRKIIDCRTVPSDFNCTLAISGEPDEVLTAAAHHAVNAHGHDDSPELRDYLRAALSAEQPNPTRPGAFIQLIQFQTDRIDEVSALVEDWAKAIGADRAARWAVMAADRDRPNTYVEIVEFPDHPSAMANSAHPATQQFGERMAKLCSGRAQFTNLDVHSTPGH